ncbi:MAG TPA: hypothetical protein ENF41_02155 [Candidatus Bathyarchaeota archaeon]|nr:hypothetical protein [Candidatus Bathyarchaeota archaeon]
MDRSLNIVHLVPGMSDDVLARGNPCKKCKEARRRELLRVLSSYKEWKMVTAHTLSDLIAYTISLLLHSNFNLSNLQPDHRVIEVLSRFYPSLKLESMQIIRPLLNLSERDVSRILSETGIPTIEKCMYSSWRPKRVFFKYLDLFPHTLTYSELINFLQKHDLPNKFENLIKKIPWTETVL